MSEVKEGDTVMLKSGGPVMTVGSAGNGSADCYWFNHDAGSWDIKWTSVKVTMLKKIETN